MRLSVCMFERHRLAQFLTDRGRSGTNRFRILPGMSRTKKILKKGAVDGRHLVITVKLAQFLTDRTQSGINRFRMLPGVS